MIKAFAFDLDGTLTQHKTPLDDKNRAVLEKLYEKYTLVMVGAGNCMRIHNQLGGFPIDVIGNYGMQYAKYTGGELKPVRESAVECKDKNSIEEKVNYIRKKHGFTSFTGDNVEYHASGCITLPLLGTKANQSDKLAFDPDRKNAVPFTTRCASFLRITTYSSAAHPPSIWRPSHSTNITRWTFGVGRWALSTARWSSWVMITASAEMMRAFITRTSTSLQ